MPPKALPAETVKIINKWRKYRDPKAIDLTAAAARDYYRKSQYVQPKPPSLPPAFITPFIGPPTAATLPDVGPITPERQEFLARTLAEPQIIAADGKEAWAGTKFLGEGGNAMVGLWRYGQTDKYVVVKELLAGNPNPQTANLRDEGAIMAKLKSGSHMVKILVEPINVTPKNELLIPGPWKNVVRRLLMEYCPLGNLEDLLVRRIQEQKPVSEATLWKIFNCLIDGATNMEYGGGEITEELVPPPAIDTGVVHFDLKPENIFMSPQDTNHKLTPIFKVGDFGHAMEFRNDRDWETGINRAEMALWRDKGTDGYYTPEQFTAAWDYTGYTMNEMVGRYDWRTNIWGIGCIMWQLATLNRDPVNIAEPFLPIFKEKEVLGISYGKNLDAYPFSNPLKATIWECLYENRIHRPPLSELKKRAIFPFKAIESKGEKVDVYGNLVPPGPQSATAVPAEPQDTTLVTCTCVARIRKGNRVGQKCGRKAAPMTQADIDADRARCAAHPIATWPETGD